MLGWTVRIPGRAAFARSGWAAPGVRVESAVEIHDDRSSRRVSSDKTARWSERCPGAHSSQGERAPGMHVERSAELALGKALLG
jgi:hypothetical protein